MSESRFVAHISEPPDPPRTRHTGRRGGGVDELLPAASILLLEVEADGSAQIYRFALDGEFAGDTWHESKTDAQDQLEYEYGSAAGLLIEVPSAVPDGHEFALEWARQSLHE